MEFEQSLKDYAAFPKNEELADLLLALQDETLKAGDLEAFLKTTTLLTDTYLYLQNYDAAVAMLAAILRQNAFEDYKTIVAVVDKLVGLLLKTEDFLQLEQVLNYRTRFIAGMPSQTMMQQFYLSVCQEGLKKYPEAIAALLLVPDNISNNNLVSKYLKLAMLYLKTEDLEAARNAFEHALIFDKTRKNEMFWLVESDILYAEARYLNSLKAYQDFFLRSKAKNRYLDRYVLINLKLGNFEEAWNFYLEYEKKAETGLSKNYRLELYQAGLKIAETLRKYEEAATIKERIIQLSDREPEIIDSFDGVRALLDAAARLSPAVDKRDVLLETFRNVNRLVDIPRCMFIAPALDGILVETYKKGLLIDKTHAAVDLTGSVIGSVIDADRDYLLLTKNEFGEIIDHADNRPLKDSPCLSVQAFKIKIQGTTAGFMVIYLEKDRHFDYVNKLLITVRSILENKWETQRLRENDAVALQMAGKVFHVFQIGVFRIEAGYLFLVDEQAKALLETDRSFLPYEEFQDCVIDKKLYVDDFVGKKELRIPITGFRGRRMLWNAIVWQEDAVIHFAAMDILETETTRVEAVHKADQSLLFGLGSMHAFATFLATLEVQSSLQRWTASGLSRLAFEDWNAAINILIAFIKKGFGDRLRGFFQAEDGSLLSIVDTIDKRILDRVISTIIADAAAAMKENLPKIADPVIRVGVVNILKNRTLAENLAKARLAATLATKTAPFRHYDRDLMLWENRTEAVASHLTDLLKNNGLAASYTQIGNVFTKKVEMYRAALHPDPLIGDIELLRETVRRYGLATSVSRALYAAVLKDAEWLFREKEVAVRFAIPVHPISLMAAGFVDDLIKIARRRKIPCQRIVIVVLPDGEVSLSECASVLYALSASGFAVGFDGRSAGLSPWEEKGAPEWDYVWFNPSVIDMPAFRMWEAYADGTKATLVAAPVDDESVASKVRNVKIGLIEGALLPAFSAITAIADAIH